MQTLTNWRELLDYPSESETARHTRSGTILSALTRIGPIGTQDKVIIHIVGADFMEGNTVAETQQIFRILFQQLQIIGKDLHIVLVGPNVHPRLHQVRESLDEMPREIQLEYFSELWELYRDSSMYQKPDIAFCFNAGVWGYDSWLQTFENLCDTEQVPVIVTSYNRWEAADDCEALEDYKDARGLKFEWKWKPEENPFASTFVRQSKSVSDRTLADNAYWQCIGPPEDKSK